MREVGVEDLSVVATEALRLTAGEAVCGLDSMLGDEPVIDDQRLRPGAVQSSYMPVIVDLVVSARDHRVARRDVPIEE